MKVNKIIWLLLGAFIFSACLSAPDVCAQRPDIVIKELIGVPPKAEPYEEAYRLETKTYTAKTKDGWEISIERYRLAKEVSLERPKAAVILCHGFNINNTFWDIDPHASLARYLAKNGYDVWAPSLRGSGLSSRPVMSRIRSLAKFDLKSVPNMLIKTPFDIGKFGWTIDDHIYEDIPAIIELVKKESGFDKVYWIGHSMGGIIMYAYLETLGQDDVAGFIPLGSMMFMPRPLPPHLKRIASQKPMLTASLIVNTTVASQLRNFTFGTIKNPIEELLFESANMADEVLVRFFRSCIDDTAAGVVTQFSDSIRSGAILSADRRFNYTESLDRITVPILIMGGSKDGFVDAEALKNVYDSVSSRDKSFIIASTENGYTADYGHCDLVIGKTAEQDVYPAILSWLDKRAVKRSIFGHLK